MSITIYSICLVHMIPMRIMHRSFSNHRYYHHQNNGYNGSRHHRISLQVRGQSPPLSRFTTRRRATATAAVISLHAADQGRSKCIHTLCLRNHLLVSHPKINVHTYQLRWILLMRTHEMSALAEHALQFEDVEVETLNCRRGCRINSIALHIPTQKVHHLVVNAG